MVELPKAGFVDPPKLKELGAAPLCVDPKLIPLLLDVVFATVELAEALKLNPIPLAVVVSGFCRNETALPRLPEFDDKEEIPEITELDLGATETDGFAPKVKEFACVDSKLRAGGDIMTADGLLEMTAEGIKGKMLAGVVEVPTFDASLAAPNVNDGVPVAPKLNAVVEVAAEIEDVIASGALGTWTAGLATGVKVISDLFASIDGCEVGISIPGVEKIANGEILPDFVEATEVLKLDESVVGAPN